MNVKINSIYPTLHEILVETNGHKFGITLRGSRPPTEEEGRQFFENNRKHFWIEVESVVVEDIKV